MKDGQFYNIQGWMGKYLELRGNDLICFAVIYSFSMDGESQFKGNLSYLGSCMFATKPTVLLALNHLLECNLIIKQEDVKNGKKRCFYSTNIIYDEGRIEVIESEKKPISMISKVSLLNIGKDALPNKGKEPLPKEYNNKDNKEENKEKKYNKKSSRFVKPTVEQVQAYAKEKNYVIDAEYFIDYYETRGWKLKGGVPVSDWKACVRTWMRNEKKNNNSECSASEQPEGLPVGLDATTWEKFKAWGEKDIPRIIDRISPNDYLSMLSLAHYDKAIMIELLKEINDGTFEGDLVKFYEELRESPKYWYRILGEEP